MDHFRTKLNLVFTPAILLALSFILCYSLLYLIFYIWLKVAFEEDIVKLWTPVIFASLAVFIFVRPRVHLLKLDKDNGRIRTLYYLVAAGLLSIPTILATSFIDTSTGKLTELNDIKEINQKPQTKYYTVKNYYQYTKGAGIESEIRYTGKRNNNTDFQIYIAVPLVTTWDDTTRSPAAFLAYHYHKNYSERLSGSEKSREWTGFLSMSLAHFYNSSKHFVYLDRMLNNDKRENFIISARKSSLYTYESPILILKPIDEDFKNKNGNKLFYTVLSFGIAAFLWFVMIIIPGLHDDKAKKFLASNKAYIEKELKALYDSFKPVKGFVAAPVLIIINTLVYVIMVISGFGIWELEAKELLEAGAIFKPYIEKGEWWRLISGMFMHANFIHLFMNMVGLYLCGMFCENNIGTLKFTMAYFITGIAAGITSIEWHNTPVVSVGASGAIFGLYGTLLALLVFKKIEPITRRIMLIFVGITAGYNLLVGFLSEGIDNSAHIGGLIAGFLIGCYFARSNKKERTDSKYLR
jgi:rhomboid protease GluP